MISTHNKLFEKSPASYNHRVPREQPESTTLSEKGIILPRLIAIIMAIGAKKLQIQPLPGMIIVVLLNDLHPQWYMSLYVSMYRTRVLLEAAF